MIFFKSFYISKKGFWLLAAIALVFAFGMLLPFMVEIGKLLLILYGLVVLAETFLLYQRKDILEVSRTVPKSLSNGDENTIKLLVKNKVKLGLKVKLKEDLPDQLQDFTWERTHFQKGKTTNELSYTIVPSERGIYEWFNVYAHIEIPNIGLVSRRILFDQYNEVACLPSYMQFGDLRLTALVSQQKEMDSTHIRKLGQSLEFEQIKTYNSGDDFRHINWKASAKQGKLMLNQFQDERSQSIYCIIDGGRTMKTKHHGQSLQDYAINASVGLSKAILQMKDKVGLVNYYTDRCDLLKPSASPAQYRKINEMLFNIKTQETDASMELLYKFSRNQIKHRSLLILFTHFDNTEAIKRNIPYLRAMGRFHLVLIVLFENDELQSFADTEAEKLTDIYSTTIAREQINQQKVLARELRKYGIITLITSPSKLTISVVNQYLEIKRKQMI